MKRKLQRKRGARRVLLRNLATSLILYEKIKTTLDKAKEVRPMVERLVQRGKKGDLACRRYLLKFLPKNAVSKIIEDLAPSFLNRESGFVRMLRLGKRKGDAAEMVLLQFVERPHEVKTEKLEVRKEEHKNEQKTDRKSKS